MCDSIAEPPRIPRTRTPENRPAESRTPESRTPESRAGLPQEPLATIRPLEASDGPGLLDLGSRLSLETRYRRFFSPLRTLPAPLLAHLVTVDHQAREALAAVVGDQIVAVARYDRLPTEPTAAEAAVVVADDWQRRGLGYRLLLDLSRLAAQRGIQVFTASTLVDNRPIAGLLHQLWPAQHGHFSEGLYRYRLPLPVAASGAAEVPTRARSLAGSR